MFLKYLNLTNFIRVLINKFDNFVNFFYSSSEKIREFVEENIRKEVLIESL